MALRERADLSVLPAMMTVSQNKTSILIVDDRRENILALESLLEHPDLEIISANSGNDALALSLDHDFALVLMDVQMPNMDGFETAELMRGTEKTRHIPIIFVTAISKDQKYVFKGYESGAVDYLFKPLKPEILKGKVRVFLEIHRQKILIEGQARALEAKISELEVAKRQLQEANRKLESLSAEDSLTGIPNRRRFDDFLRKEWLRAKRSRSPLSLIMVDIDFFKAYNDNYGHQAGDVCLARVARMLTGSLNRASDLVARYGGEEFVAVLIDTDTQGAIKVAESMRTGIELLAISHDHSPVSPYVTISLGVATVIPTDNFAASSLIDAADKTLYEAKQQGRNQTRTIQLG